ncbi:glycosyltransferase family 4 protein [Deferribacter thermophilus]|uniref:glycosyltransferase family 4 protein n=1 Tax=Deferribacter thermophilus TaxID=53573 RepID=UPI003C1F92E7
MNHKFKILFITDSKKKSSGGIKQLLYNAEALKELGYKIYLSANKESFVAKKKDIFEEIHFIDSKSKLKSALSLKKFVSEKEIDIEHTFHNGGHKIAFLAKLFGGKFKLFINRGVLKVPTNIFIYKNFLIDGFICNSYACKNSLKRIFVSDKKINIIFNCIKSVASDKNFKKDYNRFKVLYIGNSSKIKGFDIFNEIVKRVPTNLDIEFVALGVEKDKLSIKVDKRINLPGTVKNVSDYLEKAHLFLLTSRSESFPNSLLEAMAFGLGVVAHNVGAVNDLIKDGVNGFKINRLAVNEFVDKLIYLYNNRNLIEKMGHKNRLIVEKLNCKNKALKLLKVYSGEYYLDTFDVILENNNDC